MNCAIMQPTYLPWCGYFSLIDCVDNFVFLDDVKLAKSNWHVRNKIKTASGSLLLSTSISTPKGRSDSIINEVLFAKNNIWRKKHLKSIELNYRKALYFNDVFPFIEDKILNGDNNLSTFNIDFIISLSEKFNIKTNFHRTSFMSGIDGEKEIRLVKICKKLLCNQYISPVGAAQYLESKSPGGEIVKANIELKYQKFEHPVYSQLFGNFISHLSIIDLLFNVGFEQSINLIRQGNKLTN